MTCKLSHIESSVANLAGGLGARGLDGSLVGAGSLKRRVRAGVASRGFITWPLAVMLVILIGALAFAFHFFFMQQHRFSKESADWSHAYMVPLISAYLLWQKREALAKIKPTVFWPGLVPLFMAVPCYMLFQIGALSTHMGQGFAVILGIFGLALFLLGPKMMPMVFLPIAFLVFGVTIAERVMIEITFRLQGVAAYGGWAVLNLYVNTELQGHTLQVIKDNGEKIPLNIAEACSGMRMVIAFAALSVAVALVGLKYWWQRIALMLIGLPVAIAMNILRVVVLAIGSLYNPEIAKGEAHMFVGLLLLILAFLVFMGIAWLLARTVREEGSSKKASSKLTKSNQSKPPSIVLGPRSWRALTSPGFVVACVVLLVSGVAMNSAIAAMGVYLKKLPIQPAGNRQVSAIPVQTENWVRVGEDEQMSKEMLEELGTQNYLSRMYAQRKVAPGQRPVRMILHLAYYTGMIDTVPHVPERCMTGAGFVMVESAQVKPIPLNQDRWIKEETTGLFTAPTGQFSDVPGTRVRLPKGIENLDMRFSSFQGPTGGMAHAGYFFVANGGLSSSAEGVRLLAFKLNDDYAYYLKVQVYTPEMESSAVLAQHAASLLSELMPEIARTVPDWVDVQAGTFPADNPRARKVAGSNATK
jgi:exosortase